VRMLKPVILASSPIFNSMAYSFPGAYGQHRP
jgi:hypothetical protein